MAEKTAAGKAVRKINGDGPEGLKECPEDPVLQEDLEIVARDRKLADSLRGKRILVTGATGLVGSWLVRALACMNRIGNNGMEIYGAIRNEEKARTIYGDVFLARPDVHFVKADITADDFVEKTREQIRAERTEGALTAGAGAPVPGICVQGEEKGAFQHTLDLVIHGAAVTTSKIMVEKPVETILTAILGTRNVLELARECGARDFVYLSSMEMYGNLAKAELPSKDYAPEKDERPSDIGKRSDQRSIENYYATAAETGREKANREEEKSPAATEDRLGWLDLTAVRTDYPESKRMCENLCIGFGHEYGIRVKIARLAQTFGAGILPWEGRVFAQFARSAMAGEDIVLHTRGLSEGNYCYTRDAVRGILTVAVHGAAGEAYNVANESTHTTIGAMAEMVASKIAGGKIQVVYDIPAENTFGYAADTKLRLDASKLRGLGWKPEVGLEEMYRRMIASMRAEGEA